MKKHVLITGGSGFIGSHLCDELLRRGYAVTAVDNLCTGRQSNLNHALEQPDFDFIKKDVCERIDETDVPFITRYGLHGVLHFACPASPVDFDRIPFEILAVDSIGTMNTVDLALKHGSRYVLASTSEIYGDPLVHPQTEDYWGNVNTIGPRSCYDETKRFAEAYVSTAHRDQTRGPLNGGMVRIFNTYGPRMRPDDGRVVPELLSRAMKGQPLSIHGDGQQTRSFCFVTDLVDGIIRYFESDLHEPINLGNPVEQTILAFAEAVMKVSDRKLELEKLPARPDDPKRRCPDITRARKKLGWEPKVPVDDGIRRTYEYFKEELQIG